MNIAIIYGSVRNNRQGIKAARFIEKKLKKKEYKTTLIDPLEIEIPLLHKVYKEYEADNAPENLKKIHQILKEADGFVIVSAEYNHTPPPALINIIDHFLPEFLYKPSGIVTYSAGPFGGVRSLHTLRSLMAEVGAPSIPTAFPISKVQDAFDEEGNAIEKAYNERVEKFLKEFDWYLNALKNHRQTNPM
ncbi:NADPH-dependent FMN reductase [Candidatus Peregrinibacteria bacterium]|nr:NADPH-dependent FMN reductase [Candidatus Peregrinibacteria bacterium]